MGQFFFKYLFIIVCIYGVSIYGGVVRMEDIY